MPGRLTYALFCLLIGFVIFGCGKAKNTPVPIQYLQVEGSYLSEGYDVYQFVAVKHPLDRTPEKMNALLDYFENKYKNSGKVKVMVFTDAQSAIQGISDNILATLEMNNGEVVMRTVNVS